MARQTYELKATVRDRVGKGAARALRRNAEIPAVIYGDKKPPLSIAISYKEAFQRLHGGGFLTTVATIDVAGEKILVIPKDFHLDPVRDFLTHVDFLRISPDAVVTVWVPVHVAGEEKSPGIKKGGSVNYVHHDLELQCKATAIPEEILIDISEMDFGDVVHVNEIKFPEGSKPVVHEKLATVLSITAPIGAETAAA
jgi:large subunit ribosomal protein L25